MLAASLYIDVVSLVTVLKTMPADGGSSDSNSEYSGPDSVERITRAKMSFDPYMSKFISFNSENVSGPNARTTIMSSMELSESKRRQRVEDSVFNAQLQSRHGGSSDSNSEYSVERITRAKISFDPYMSKFISFNSENVSGPNATTTIMSSMELSESKRRQRVEDSGPITQWWNIKSTKLPGLYYPKVIDSLYIIERILIHRKNEHLRDVVDLYNVYDELWRMSCGQHKSTDRCPFITIEGLDESSARTVAIKFATQTGSAYLENPPVELWDLRHRFYNQTALLKRTFYAVANYYVAKQALKLVKNQPIILSRYYYTGICRYFALRYKERLKAPPCRGSKSYQWPLDLFQPDVAFYIHVDQQKKKRQLQFQKWLLAQNFPESYLTVMKNTRNPKVVILDGNMAPEILLNKIHRHLKQVGLNISVILWRSK